MKPMVESKLIMRITSKKVPAHRFPDCCMVCKNGRKYYSNIQCHSTNHEFLGYSNPTDLCALFKRDNRQLKNWETQWG